MQTDPNFQLRLPEGAQFTDLKLRRCDTEAIDMDMDLIERICQLNQWNVAKVRENPGPVISTILSVWYKTHLAAGGTPDAVMESLRAPAPLQ
ncbi:MAG: hypothetical protein U5L73_05010 [Rhodoferax sp.]|uniref:hypothetical protein n=1 Tax=Rhodoferax sp. TaxID=50421 RepID=UPI002ACD904F|nr:hypothetical protein [Rhodoferax sp.]MDZ7891101.1 hypothetical protein [Rhodoferax sp.]